MEDQLQLGLLRWLRGTVDDDDGGEEDERGENGLDLVRILERVLQDDGHQNFVHDDRLTQILHEIIVHEGRNNQDDLVNALIGVLGVQPEEDEDHLRDLFANLIAAENREQILQARKMADRDTKVMRQFLRLISRPFHMNELQFRRLYRLTPEAAMVLVELLGPALMHNSRTKIPVDLQVLIILRFLGYADYQRSISQDYKHPVCQSLVSYIIGRGIDALCDLMDTFIIFPRNHQERFETQERFRRTISIPGILGIVDGFLVRLRRPSQHEEAFYNYREGHCVNVQLVCDARGIIIGLRVCPGSNNDMFNWEFSATREHMENLRANPGVLAQEGRYYMLGDNGYNPSLVLLTPIENAPEGSPEAQYTAEVCQTRSLVERTIGSLSGTWRCVNRGRKLCYSSEKVAKMVMASAVLHNFSKFHGHLADGFAPGQVAHDNGRVVYALNDNYHAGIMERNNIVNMYYAQ
ncbi:hypothetical protein QAD02_000175 [Eretmocerus hayati]|uniref:Uncharacterized protein n=1 Tax=Eretmocerus hayati TaxID=131215 RepID=A0ACC2NCV4_9HYME|nr:hypothetical protein QAD02_000175 [Eretmocerus hayati]